jgi:3-mercaptopyruvate sulfurtransferase SseA
LERPGGHVSASRAAFFSGQAHIPGAQFVDLVAELSGRGTVPNGERR